LKKAGLTPDAPLVLDALPTDGWVTLRSGALAVATCATRVRGAELPLVVAVAFESALEVALSGQAVA
jgi:hypothetical protein